MFLCYEEILCGCALLDRFQSYVFFRWLVGEKKAVLFNLIGEGARLKSMRVL